MTKNSFAIIAVCFVGIIIFSISHIIKWKEEMPFFSAYKGKICYSENNIHSRIKQVLKHDSLKDCIFYINSYNNESWTIQTTTIK